MKNGNESAIKNINRKITYRFLLDGEELPLSDIMDNPTITYDCGLEQYSVGNLYIGELSFSVKNTVFVNYKSQIEIEIRQIDGYTYYTDYIGTFYVSTVEEQGLTKRIKAYDKLFTLNVGYFPSAKHTSTKAIMEDIARKHYIIINQNGVGLDEIFKWTYGDIPINNEQLEGKTVLEMLSLVAGVYGGSFFVDGYGFLKLTQPTLATSNVTFTQSEYSVPTLDDTTTYNITKLRVIYGEQTTNDDGSIKDTGYYEVGSGTDTHTLAISNPLLKGQQAQARTILNQIKAMNGYKRFDTTILLGDYRLEPMDVITYVKGDTSYKVPIIYMQYVLTHKGLTVKTQSPTIAESKKEFSFKGTITQKIDNVYTEVMQVKDIVANTITVNELEAINAKIENLQATDATITNLVAGKANIEDLNATNATIENLKATDAEITNLVANKADIKDLNATNATIDNLQADVADINTLLAGNITSGNIQSGSITSDKLVIDDGFIKDAMIDTISANKILAGRLDTGAITIGSEDGKMIIADETIQISDGTNVRVQIGETANGDYALVIWDENGEVMFDATGITEHAIKDAIIKDDMVSDNANINAQKIDITSLFTVINEDGSHTLNGSKIFLDTQQQTLNVAFNSMTTKQDELEEKTDTLTTELTVQSGQIETLVKNTTITDNGQEVLLKDKVSSITQDIDSITTKVETVESNVTDLSQRVASAELKITDDAIVSTVTNSQVFKDAVVTNGTTTGGRNYILNSNFARNMENWSKENDVTISHDGIHFSDIESYAHLTRTNCTLQYYGIYQTLTTKGMTDLTDDKWTLSCWYYAPKNAIFDGGIKLSVRDNNAGIIEKVIYANNIVKGEWTRIICSGELGSPRTVYFELEYNGEIYVTNFKLEQGGVATDWNLATEDIDASIKEVDDRVTINTQSISTLEQTANSIQMSVSETNQVVSQVGIGVKNLIRNSAFMDNFECWTKTGATLDKERVLGEHPSAKLIHAQLYETQKHLKQMLTLGENKEKGIASTGEFFAISFWYYVEDKMKFVPQVLKEQESFNDTDNRLGAIRLGLRGKVIGLDYTDKDYLDKYINKSDSDDYYDSPVLSVSVPYKDIVEKQWTRVESSIKIPTHVLKDANGKYNYTSVSFESLKLYLGLLSFGEVWITDVMVTKGSKSPSNWIIAPEDTNEELKDLNDKVIINTENIASLQINADSINASVQRVETTMNNSLSNMNNNIETLTNRVDATMTAEDIKFAISQEVANGTSKVTTETGFVFDKDGLTISKSDSEMSTLVDEDGMTIYKNNDVMLDVNNQGVDAQNIKVSTYLIVGNNSRFENYGSLRTGCFFIGQTTATTSEEE